MSLEDSEYLSMFTLLFLHRCLPGNLEDLLKMGWGLGDMTRMLMPLCSIGKALSSNSCATGTKQNGCVTVSDSCLPPPPPISPARSTPTADCAWTLLLPALPFYLPSLCLILVLASKVSFKPVWCHSLAIFPTPYTSLFCVSDNEELLERGKNREKKFWQRYLGQRIDY
jgi:hypothetical protein